MRPAFDIYIFDNEPVVKPINVVSTNLRRISTFNIKKQGEKSALKKKKKIS